MSIARTLMNHLEIILTFLGIPVIFIIPMFFGYDHYWQVLAVTAIAVGIVHGLLFWMVRGRQRRVRQEAIRSIRDMLTDRIKNQLQIVLFAASESGNAESRERVSAAMDAASEISRTLDQLSMDSLKRWELQYAGWTQPKSMSVGQGIRSTL